MTISAALKKYDQIKYNCLNSYVRFENKINFIPRNFKDGYFGVFFKLRNKYSYFKNKFFNKRKYLIKIFYEMEPRIENKIEINKTGKIICSLSFGKKEINTIQILLKKIVNKFSNKPHLEKIHKLRKKNIHFDDASHHMGGLRYP